MTKIKRVLYIFILQFISSLASARVWIGYLFGFVVSLKTAYAYCGNAGDRAIQIFEPVIENYIKLGNITLMLIGFIIVLSDAPFINNRSTLALYRTSRKQWYWGMSLYILAHCVLYYVVSAALVCLFSMKQAFINNIWSRPMRNLALAPSREAMIKWNLATPARELVERYTPVETVFHTLLLIMLYSLILVLVLFIFNAAFNKAAGSAVAAGIHVAGFILALDGFGGISKPWSAIYNSVFMHHSQDYLSLGHSYLFFAAFIVILLIIGPCVMKRVDFKHSTGEEYE